MSMVTTEPVALPADGTTAPPNPYVGPRAFGNNELLYGRDGEVAELMDLLIARRIVLLYSPSGAGKTSLIQAKLLAALANERFHVRPMIRVSRELPQSTPVTPDVTPGEEVAEQPKWSQANRYTLSTLLSLEEAYPEDQQLAYDELAGMDLDSYLSKRRKGEGAEGAEGVEEGKEGNDHEGEWEFEVLIFDQFEEILTLDLHDIEQKHAFFMQVGVALRNRNRWALFVIREEFLAAFDPYVHHIPTRLATTFRLDLLTQAQALLAIREPAKRVSVDFTQAAAEKLVSDLSTVRVQRPDANAENQVGAYVEPMQLQVVCHSTWEKWTAGKHQVLESEISSVGTVDEALSGYYEDHVKSAAAKFQVPEGKVRSWIGSELITEQGIRGQVLMGPETSKGLDTRVILQLVEDKLLRKEARHGAIWFELAHDRLVEPIRKNNSLWFEQNQSILQRQAELWAKARSQEGKSNVQSNSLLLRDKALSEAETWARGQELNEIEKDFLAASQSARDATRRIRLIVAAFASLLIAALGVITYLWLVTQGQKNVLAAREFALLSSELSANSSELAANAISKASDQLDLALLLSVQSFNVRDTIPARSSMLATLEHNPHLHRFLHAHSGTDINSIAISSDGRMIAAGGSGSITLWRFSSPDDVIAPYTEIDIPAVDSKTNTPLGPVTSLSFSPDGKTLASGDNDTKVILWDIGPLSEDTSAASTSQVKALQVKEMVHSIKGVVFNNDGRWLAAYSGDVVEIIDVNSSYASHTISLSLDEGGGVERVAFSPDNQHIAIGYNSNFFTYGEIERVSGGSEPVTFTVESLITSLAFSLDGQALAVGEKDGTITLWPLDETSLALNAESVVLGFDIKSTTMETVGQHSGEVLGLGFDPTGQRLVSLGADGDLLLWSRAADKTWKSQLLSRRKGAQGSIAFSADHLQMATFDHQAIMSWGLIKSCQLCKQITYGDAGITQATAMNTQWLAASDNLGTISLWPAPARGTASASPSVLALAGPGTKLDRLALGESAKAGKPDSSVLRLAATNEQGTLLLWDIDLSDPSPTASISQTLLEASGIISSLALGPNGGYLAVSSAPCEEDNASCLNYRLDVWHISPSFPLTYSLTISASGLLPVRALSFSPDGQHLASGGVDKNIYIWDLKATTPTSVTLDLRSDEAISALAYSPNGSLLAIGYDDGSLHLWDHVKEKETASLPGRTGRISTLSFSADGDMLAAGTDGGSVTLWYVNKIQKIQLFGSPLVNTGKAIQSVRFSEDGKDLVAVDVENNVTVWDLRVEERQEQICRMAGRDLTDTEKNQYLGDRLVQSCVGTDVITGTASVAFASLLSTASPTASATTTAYATVTVGSIADTATPTPEPTLPSTPTIPAPPTRTLPVGETDTPLPGTTPTVGGVLTSTPQVTEVPTLPPTTVPTPTPSPTEVPSATPIEVPTATPARLEPSGRILFASNRENPLYSHVYIMNVDGTGQRVLTKERLHNLYPDWSPDGKWIVYVGAPSPNSSGSPGGDLYFMELSSSRVITLPTQGHAKWPKWSPDGLTILYADAPSNEAEEYDIWTLPIEIGADGSAKQRAGSSPKQLTDAPGFDGFPTWADDGKLIIFTSERASKAGSQLWSMSADGDGEQALTSANGDQQYPAVSHDGTRIAFTSTRDGSYKLYVMDRNGDGSDAMAITSGPGRDLYPTWSPDDRWIAFHSNRDDAKNYEIYIVELKGGAIQRLTTDPAFDDEPAWGPDSRAGE